MTAQPTYEELAERIRALEKEALDLKRTEESLRNERNLANILVQSSPAFFVAINAEGEIIMMNKAMLKALGYSRDEVEGRNYLSCFVPVSDHEKLAKIFDQLVRLKQPAINENRILSKEGRELLVRWHGSPVLEENGELDFFFGVGIDISEQKKLEAQLFQAQKMEAVGTLAGGVAHDFNNLLQSVLGYSDLLLMGKDTDEPGYLELQAIKGAAKRASELTRQLLTFGRRVESKPRPVDLNHEVEDVKKLLQRTIPKMIDIELHLADGLMTIDADPGQIGQMLMNLGINARDAMDSGGQLTIETENVALDETYCKTHLGAAPGSYVRLTISDTGTGMDKETIKHIFEPFYTTKDMGKGTGLGLAMVYGIVKSHNGYIMCYSEPDNGTVFRIYLPGIEQKTDLEGTENEETPLGGTETILLVDDDEFVRSLGNQALSMFQYRVIAVPDGESALEIYMKGWKDIALIILDLIMPGMGGMKCLEETLKINPQAKVIVASGYTVKGPAKEAIDSGAKGFISKPYDIKKMLSTVREVLDAD